jgi:cellobiose phosphorylase
VAWVRLASEEWMLGVRPEYDGLHVEPCLPDNFGTYKVERIWRQAKYNITVQQGEDKGIVADGVAIEGNVLPAYEDGLNHEIIVTI